MASQPAANSSHTQTQNATASTGSGGALPQDGNAIISMLRELGVTEFEPRVVSQLLDFAYGYVKDVLSESRNLANHAGHKQIDCDDVRVAVQFWSDRSFSTALPAPSVINEMAQVRNSQPLPAPRPTAKPVAGLRLPPDRHCLTQATYHLRSNENLPAQPQQRFIAQPQQQNPAIFDHRPAGSVDHRSYANQPFRPASNVSNSHAGSNMITDYDN